MGDSSLLTLAKEVRGKTLRVLEGVNDDEARWAPAGTRNTMLWHAGHALVLAEYLCIIPATGQTAHLPAGWFELFKWGSAPKVDAPWPSIGAVVAQLGEQQHRLIRAIEGATDEILSKPVGDPARNRTVCWSVVHGLHDEANHQGEIYLLRKMVLAGHAR